MSNPTPTEPSKRLTPEKLEEIAFINTTGKLKSTPDLTTALLSHIQDVERENKGLREFVVPAFQEFLAIMDGEHGDWADEHGYAFDISIKALAFLKQQETEREKESKG